MSAITFYDLNGAITGTLQGDLVVIEANKETTEESWIDGLWDSKTHYVLNGEAVIRPENPATLTGCLLENVPVPSKLFINTTKYTTEESSIELEFDQPGSYTIKIMSWPYLSKEFLIENPTL